MHRSWIMISLAVSMPFITPVSYTHLDVYKRQQYGYADRKERRHDDRGRAVGIPRTGGAGGFSSQVPAGEASGDDRKAGGDELRKKNEGKNGTAWRAGLCLTLSLGLIGLSACAGPQGSSGTLTGESMEEPSRCV